MIRNIVFDMGNVLVNYDGSKVCEHFIEEEEARARIKSAVFVSPEWIFLDMGVMTEEEALKRMQSRLKTEKEKQQAADCLRHWPEYNMFPVEEMGPVIRELKEKGFGVYLCSNANMRMSRNRQLIPAIDLFDGMLFSAEEKCIKPQKEIYERLFEKFDLKPEECYFIDDMQLNIDGAAACGMPGYCHDGDVDKLIEVLRGL